MPHTHQIEVSTTAKFIVEGEFNQLTQGVWICFHGYGMTAEEQLKTLNAIVDENVVIVCVEGFHRFYTDNPHTKVGVSWMTKELRLEDIKNNILYCNSVLSKLEQMGMTDKHKLSVLGFSQGGHTMSRWVAQLQRRVDVCLLWGSGLPDDVIDDHKAVRKLNESGLRFIVGDRDKYIPSDKIDEEIDKLHDRGVSFDFHTFDGGHRLDDYTLRYFHARLLDNKTEY